MLHEILLSLSGHASPAFDHTQSNGDGNVPFSPVISLPEGELLSSVRRVAQLHRAIRSHAVSISSSHPSSVCQAVSSSILLSHLTRLQDKILEIESQILTGDSSIVGAYNIVPLSSISSQFYEWTVLMEWYWSLVSFMLPAKGNERSRNGLGSSTACTGAAIIDKLHVESKSGVPAIKDAALDLSRIADITWLKQASAWILYGRLPTFGAQDFFIRANGTEGGAGESISDPKFLPKFVTSRTASSILFIGRSLNRISALGMDPLSDGLDSAAPDADIHRMHLQHLTDVTLPISSADLAGAVSAIRISLSRGTLRRLLPLSKIIQVLSILQEYFLLGRGEFALSLVHEADERLRSRKGHRASSQHLKTDRGVQNVLVKDGEVSSILSRAWIALSSYLSSDETAEEALDFARDLIHLRLRRPSSSRLPDPGRAKESIEPHPVLSAVSFYEFLLSVPVELTMDIPSPLDLFLGPSDMEIYSALHSYLLAIRRSHVHLTELWKETPSRRDHPAPRGPPQSNSSYGRRSLRDRRRRAKGRTMHMRDIWATCSAAVFLLSECTNYFEGEVVRESWTHLHKWIVQSMDASDPGDALQSTSDNHTETFHKAAPQDPETLAIAHRRFLSLLAYSLLLTDAPYTKALRSFFVNADLLVALVKRLQGVQRHLDLEEDDGVVDALANYQQDEKDVKFQLSRARGHLDNDMKSLVSRLRELDVERTGSGALTFPAESDLVDYVPWSGGGIDRLLMRLDFGIATVGDNES